MGLKGRLWQLLRNYVHEDAHCMEKKRKEIMKKKRMKREENKGNKKELL